MTERVFNFSAGPSTIADEVLERARDEMLSLNRTGMGVMEISHRSKEFEAVLDKAENGIRSLMNVPDNYKVLFVQGGASMQFLMVPLNFLAKNSTADYIVTGAWGTKAVAEGKRCGITNVIYSSEENGFSKVPEQDELNFSPDASFVHYTSNETIEGVEFKYELEAGGIPIICDASSNILSKTIDVSKNALIYAGAQKNIGPSGVALVIVREDMLERVPKDQYSMLDYNLYARERSMPNTPNAWAIYMIGLVCDWLEGLGGVEAMEKLNIEKAQVLYDAIDSSDGFYSGHAEKSCRSLMNVTFRLPSDDLDMAFCAEATANGLNGLKGHRSVGGIRASIYNAFPRQGVDALVEMMTDFAGRHG